MVSGFRQKLSEIAQLNEQIVEAKRKSQSLEATTRRWGPWFTKQFAGYEGRVVATLGWVFGGGLGWRPTPSRRHANSVSAKPR